MARRSVFLGLTAVFVMVVLFTVHNRVRAQEATMILKEGEVFKSLERPPVKFAHEVHMEKYPECTECHHEYEYKDGKKVNSWAGEGRPCGECHKMDREGKKPELRTAFHENCTGCHRSLLKEGQKSGPVTCGECHVRTALN